MKLITFTIETSGYKKKQFTDEKGNKIEYYTICTPQGEIKASREAINNIMNDGGSEITYKISNGIIKLCTEAEAQKYAPTAW